MNTIKNILLKLTVPAFILLGLISISFNKQQENGLSVDEYFKKVTTKDSVVLVYFNADWCVPCIKLKPVISELEKENPAVKVLKLDVDANPKIAQHFEINTLPLFFIYKNGKQVWTNNTYMSKKDLQDKLRFYH